MQMIENKDAVHVVLSPNWNHRIPSLTLFTGTN